MSKNSPDRFRKSSDRLALTVHSHCEIPAGCGGVVFQYRDRALGVPFLFLAVTNDEHARMELRIDGNKPPSAQATLVPGPHVVCLELRFETAEPRPLYFAAISDPILEEEDPGMMVLSGSAEVRVVDGHTINEDWWTVDYDDNQWPLAQTRPQLAFEHRNFALQQASAEPILLPASTRVLIRTRLVVP